MSKIYKIHKNYTPFNLVWQERGEGEPGNGGMNRKKDMLIWRAFSSQ